MILFIVNKKLNMSHLYFILFCIFENCTEYENVVECSFLFFLFSYTW